MNRLYNLDYIRGMAAFGIMIFHYLSWIRGEFYSDSFMGRVGIYGVSIFYILSGLTLFHVYQDKILLSWHTLLDFFKKRIYRIFPLLWLATIATIVLSKKSPEWTTLILNLTGLFGFFDWNTYYATGAWSIGNELVFYFIFPVLIFFKRKSILIFSTASILIFILYLYFSFYLMDHRTNLSEQWKNYVNPFNQLFFFLSGIIIGMIFKNTSIKNYLTLLMLAIGLALFILYPSSGDRIYLVTGYTRIFFTISCLLICLGFYKLEMKLPALIDKPLLLLGEASYSLYLLHPIVYFILKSVFVFLEKYFYLPKSILLISSVTITICLSYIVYKHFEKYFIELGKKQR